MRRRVAGWLAGAGVTALVAAAALRPGRPQAASVAAAADTSIVSRSIDFFEARLAADPNNYLIAGRLASRYLVRFSLAADSRDVARAEELARRLTTLAPDRAGAMSRLSGILLAQHQFAGSLAAARDAVAADAKSEEALGALFDANLASGAYRQAETVLKAMRPGSLATLVRRAQWLDASGHARGASETMDRVCRRLERSAVHPPARAWCLTELAGLVHRDRGPDAAESILKQALAVQPGYRGALEGLADLAAARGEWRNARDIYRRIAVDAHPDLYLRLAEVAPADERAEWERRFLDVASDPAREPLYAPELALFLAERGGPGDRAAALAIALREVSRRPTTESLDLLSWVHYRRGEAEAALSASDRAMAFGSPSAGQEYHRGRILEAMGRVEEAAALLHRAGEQRSLLPAHARLDGEWRSARARS
jgi:tetratricopeptide (TPR) repeat protein